MLALPLLQSSAQAQLLPAGTPVPNTTLPPVVFINGYQFEGCSGTTFAGTFGIADQVLQSNGEVSLFFNTCIQIERTRSEQHVSSRWAGRNSIVDGCR